VRRSLATCRHCRRHCPIKIAAETKNDKTINIKNLKGRRQRSYRSSFSEDSGFRFGGFFPSHQLLKAENLIFLFEYCREPTHLQLTSWWRFRNAYIGHYIQTTTSESRGQLHVLNSSTRMPLLLVGHLMDYLDQATHRIGLTNSL